MQRGKATSRDRFLDDVSFSITSGRVFAESPEHIIPPYSELHAAAAPRAIIRAWMSPASQLPRLNQHANHPFECMASNLNFSPLLCCRFAQRISNIGQPIENCLCHRSCNIQASWKRVVSIRTLGMDHRFQRKPLLGSWKLKMVSNGSACRDITRAVQGATSTKGWISSSVSRGLYRPGSQIQPRFWWSKLDTCSRLWSFRSLAFQSCGIHYILVGWN